MTESTYGYRHAISRTAEHQMRQWAIGLEVQNRIDRPHNPQALTEQLHYFVAVSREAGVDGSEIAKRLGVRLGWDVLDQDLLMFMADRYKVPRDMLEFLDETSSNWLLELLGKWLNRNLVTQSEYVSRLGQILLLATQHADAVIVGRGAQFILPREKGLSVRIVAPLEMRIERIRELKNLSRHTALKHIKETDEGRQAFIRRYFHQDVTDSHLFDLVINREHIDIDHAVEMIAAQCRERFHSLVLA